MPDPQDAIPNDPDLTPEDIKPGADLIYADLTDVDLLNSGLPGADLRYADLPGAHLSEVDLSGITLSRSTQIDAPGERITTELVDNDSLSEEQRYDIIARANHEFRIAYSANRLISRARRARVRERKARRREALAEGGRLSRGTAAWLGSFSSKVFTGYGVQLRWVSGVMILLYPLSAGVYHFVGEMSVGRSLYYSVVTFTTSPPEPAPTGLVMRAVAGFETFAGTAAIVFLGYVLATRERV
jgi:hypothetical protein